MTRPTVKLLVSGRSTPVTDRDGTATFTIESIFDHEVAVIASL